MFLSVFIKYLSRKNLLHFSKQQPENFSYTDPGTANGTVAVSGKTLKVLQLQNIIMYLCTAQPMFDCSTIAFRMQLGKDNAQS